MKRWGWIVGILGLVGLAYAFWPLGDRKEPILSQELKQAAASKISGCLVALAYIQERYQFQTGGYARSYPELQGRMDKNFYDAFEGIPLEGYLFELFDQNKGLDFKIIAKPAPGYQGSSFSIDKTRQPQKLP